MKNWKMEEIMNLLKEGIKNGAVIKTDRATKMVVDGLSETYPVYQIRLDYLFFNNQNDRIATWINQYEDVNGGISLNQNDKENYNSIIQKFIEQSNPDTMKSTQANIELFGQREYGVVLNDGRIIDGNRRFSCLRNLSKKNNGTGFNYFEAVILDKDYEHNAKQIKMLELQIQIGEESKVDYNPIDKLVGIYRDIEENALLTVNEYAMSTNMTPNQVKKQLELSKLLVEFLDSINAPGQYYIARELDLNGPLNEIYGILNKISDEDKKNELKYVLFANLLAQPMGDMTRYVRQVKEIVNNNFLDEFIDKETEVTEKILEETSNEKNVTSATVAKIKSNEKYKEDLNYNMASVSDKAKVKKTKKQPLFCLRKASDMLYEIDERVLSRVDEEDKKLMKEELTGIINVVDDLRKVLDV